VPLRGHWLRAEGAAEGGDPGPDLLVVEIDPIVRRILEYRVRGTPTSCQPSPVRDC
jgi:hypothetical protein